MLHGVLDGDGVDDGGALGGLALGRGQLELVHLRDLVHLV
jgi:hypothetical protein